MRNSTIIMSFWIKFEMLVNILLNLFQILYTTIDVGKVDIWSMTSCFLLYFCEKFMYYLNFYF
jgi:hypothetical protein